MRFSNYSLMMLVVFGATAAAPTKLRGSKNNHRNMMNRQYDHDYDQDFDIEKEKSRIKEEMDARIKEIEDATSLEIEKMDAIEDEEEMLEKEQDDEMKANYDGFDEEGNNNNNNSDLKYFSLEGDDVQNAAAFSDEKGGEDEGDYDIDEMKTNYDEFDEEDNNNNDQVMYERNGVKATTYEELLKKEQLKKEHSIEKSARISDNEESGDYDLHNNSEDFIPEEFLPEDNYGNYGFDMAEFPEDYEENNMIESSEDHYDEEEYESEEEEEEDGNFNKAFHGVGTIQYQKNNARSYEDNMNYNDENTSTFELLDEDSDFDEEDYNDETVSNGVMMSASLEDEDEEEEEDMINKKSSNDNVNIITSAFGGVGNKKKITTDSDYDLHNNSEDFFPEDNYGSDMVEFPEDYEKNNMMESSEEYSDESLEEEESSESIDEDEEDEGFEEEEKYATNIDDIIQKITDKYEMKLQNIHEKYEIMENAEREELEIELSELEKEKDVQITAAKEEMKIKKANTYLENEEEND